MAMQTSPSAAIREDHAVLSGGDDLRSLIAGYAGVLDGVDDAPAVLWASVERPRLLRWVRIPAPRQLVRALLVRHVSRRVEALTRRRRVALADKASGPERDLAMLEQFERSLPPALRLRVIAPLALLGVLLIAYVLANLAIQARSTRLLGDLTTAAVELDRGAAVEAFERNDLEAGEFISAGVILAWSVVLVILPVLPAFSVRRRLVRGREGLAELEARGFAAPGCPRVHDLELDLTAQLLMVAAVVAFAVPITESSDPSVERDVATVWILGAVFITVAAVASTGLVRRYRQRRRGTPSRRARITSAAVWLVWALNVLVFIANTVE